MSLQHSQPRRTGCTTVRNQPKRAPRGHATGMPSPSDQSPPKRTPTKGQDKSLIPYTPKGARKPHHGPRPRRLPLATPEGERKFGGITPLAPPIGCSAAARGLRHRTEGDRRTTMEETRLTSSQPRRITPHRDGPRANEVLMGCAAVRRERGRRREPPRTS